MSRLLEKILAALHKLSKEELEILERAVAIRAHPPQSVEEWAALWDKAIDAFWGDTPPEERAEIVKAIAGEPFNVEVTDK